MNVNKTTAAFGLLAIVNFINIIPYVSWNIGIANFVAYIFEIVAACILIGNLRGIGRAGAILLLLSIVNNFITFPMQVLSWIDQINNLFENFTPEKYIDSFDTTKTGSFFDNGDKVTYHIAGIFSWHNIPFILKFILSIATSICWLIYKPFKQMHAPIILLLTIYSIYLFWNIFSGFIAFDISWPFSYIYDLIFWILGFLCVLGYLNISHKSQKDIYDQMKVKSFLAFAIGLTYTYLLIVNTGYRSLFFALIGAIVFLVGTNNLRDLTKDRTGTGAFIAYGVLIIVSAVINCIPLLGKYLAFCTQLAAFIVIGVGCFRFKKNPLFYKDRSTGMNTLGTVSILLIGGVMTAQFPIIGETLSGCIFFIIYLPMILFSFYNMIKASIPIEEIGTPQEKIEYDNISIEQVLVPNENNLKRDIESLSNDFRYVSDNKHASSSFEKNESEYQPLKIGVNREEAMTITNSESHSSSKTLYIVGGIALGLLLIVGSIVTYRLWYKPYSIDKNAPRLYTFNNTNLRSSKLAGTTYNLLTTLPYGSELIVYEQDHEWSYVKYNDTKGYIATPYLMPKEDFWLLNSIFGNRESLECIETAKCRLALLQYFKQQQIYGRPNELMGDNYLLSQQNWQVFTKDKNTKPNAVFYPRIFNRHSKFTDFAVVIKNTQTEQRQLLIFTFDDETEAPSLIYEENAPPTGDIKDISLYPNYYSKNNVHVQYGY